MPRRVLVRQIGRSEMSALHRHDDPMQRAVTDDQQCR
jgi:hypothetical protein